MSTNLAVNSYNVEGGADARALMPAGEEDTITVFGPSRTKALSAPQLLADAVISQAFRDLNTLADATKKSKKDAYETARGFLLGESAEFRCLRSVYCDALEFSPGFVERMAYAVINRSHD